MFMMGAVEPKTLSTAGMAAYHKNLTAVARMARKGSVQQDATRARMTLINAQSRFTSPRVATSLNQSRGSRKGPAGAVG